MSTEIDDILADALATIHSHMDETEGFTHRSEDAGDDDEDDIDFNGFFFLKETGIDEENNDFMNSYEFDAMLDVPNTEDFEIEFNSGDLIFRKHDNSTWEVIIDFKINGEIRVLLFKAIKTLMGNK